MLPDKQLIGRGGTSEVFAWEERRVLELFYEWFPAAKVEREFQATRLLHSDGLPVPAAYELMRLGERAEIVFEGVDGPSMVNWLPDQKKAR